MIHFYKKPSRVKQLLLACILLISGSSIYAQVDCNSILACNSNLQVSLGEDCTELVVPDMILEDPQYDDSFYTVSLFRKNGSQIVDNTLRQSMIGQRLEAKVRLNGCSSSCWGYLMVEDKLPPVITGCTDTTVVECEDSLEPGVNVDEPVATDACTNSDLDYADVVEKLDCSSEFTMVVTRTWTATDDYGNTSSCTQIINVRRASIDDVTFPESFDGTDYIPCDELDEDDYLDNGAPSPEYTGYPTGVECPNINYYFNDLVFELCGSGVKVVRQWNVLDWCTGRDTLGTQVIKVEDKEAPICSSAPDFFFDIFTDEGECTATWRVPPPVVQFECSEYDYIVGYKLRDADGNPFEFPIYDNVRRVNEPNGDYYYIISELPQDTTWIVYTITDDCGYSTRCFTEVIVKDNEKPTAICEGYSVVTLSTDGWADVYALSIDDHSEDNCEIERYEIKRLTDNCSYPSDLEFGEKVNFCCEDVSDDPSFYTKVVLRVYDKQGLFNDCVANVRVEDKINPIVTFCPPTIDIQCGTSVDTSITGSIKAVDNCSVELTFNDSENLNKCGIGTITRRWRAVDPGGRSDNSCTQQINVIDFDPFAKDDIMFPRDITINGCSIADADPVLTGSLPTYDNTDCAEIAVSYEDQVFDLPSGCRLIKRTWRLADWCNFNTNNATYFTEVQTITLENTEGPRFTSDCSNREIMSPDNDCEEYVEHRVSAIDDCTPTSQIQYRWTLDAFNDGSIDDSGTGSFTADTYPVGRHKITFIASDLCENESVCEYFFTIKDGKAPTPICHKEVVWVVDEEGQAEVWASDFNLKSFDQCTGEDNLRFSFDEDGTETVRFFECATDIPNGISNAIQLRMYVWDTDDNSEYCEVTLLLQDSPRTDACPDDPGSRGMIAGNVYFQGDEGMDDVEVAIVNINTQATQQAMTDNSGHFEYSDAKFYGAYAVKPESNKDILNGVSTLDLVHIQRHILGIEKIDQPLNLIAADVTADEKVSAADLVALRKVILGITDSYQNNNSWRFIPSTHEFEDNTYPWGFPEQVNLMDLMFDEMEVDFTSIKIGDVNNSAIANFDETETGNRDKDTEIMLDNQMYEDGDVINVPFYLNENGEVIGLQLALDINNLVLEGVREGMLKLDDIYIHEEGGQLRISVAGKTPVYVSSDQVLFTLTFRTIGKGSLINNLLQNDNVKPEVYDGHFDPINLELIVRNNAIKVETSEIVKNAPNPFKDYTTIALESLEMSEGVLNIFDAAGKSVYQRNIILDKGLNNLTITSDNLNNDTGMYIYQINTGSKLYSGKMILVK